MACRSDSGEKQKEQSADLIITMETSLIKVIIIIIVIVIIVMVIVMLIIKDKEHILSYNG